MNAMESLEKQELYKFVGKLHENLSISSYILQTYFPQFLKINLADIKYQLV